MSLNFPSGFVRMGWLPDSLYQHNDARKWMEHSPVAQSQPGVMIQADAQRK